MNRKKETPRIEVLTSLRFFAAMVIVLYHAKQNFNPLHNLPSDIDYSQGVSFFFILSGFILTYVYGQFTSVKEVGLYLFRRMARLCPLYVIVLLLSIAIVPKAMLVPPGPYPEWLVFLLNLFMLQAWIPELQFFFAYNAPAWSVSSEIFFYLALPLILYLNRYGKYYPLVLSCLITFSLIVLGNSLGLPEWSANGLSLQGILAIHPLARMTEFVAGMTAASLFIDLVNKFKPGKVIGTTLEILVFALTVLAVTYSKPLALSISALPFVGEAGRYWLTESGVPLIPFTLTIFCFAFQSGLISKLLNLKFFILLGEISFAIYLLHYPLVKYHSYYLSTERTFAPLIIFLAVLLISSHLLYKFVEVPARKQLTLAFKRFILKEETGTPEESVMERLSHLRVYISRHMFRLFGTGIEFAALGALIIFAHPTLNTISGTEALNRMQSSYCRARNIKAGKCLEISSLSTHQTKDSTTVELVLRSRNEAVIDHFVSVQMLDNLGREKYLHVSRIAPADIKVERNKFWTSTIEIPEGTDLKGVSKLGLIVAKKEFVTLEGGETDMNGKRLIIPLDHMVSFEEPDEKHL